MPWPSTISAFSNPVPSDRLNSPSHSSVETAQNTGLTELQTFIGVNTGATASAVGTLLYDIRATGSDGGGHVQAANRGGTGQTTFTLGDTLFAANSSTLSKLAVGADGQILVANSSTATGVNWVNNDTGKISTSASVITVTEGTAASVYSVTVTGSTLGISNAVRATIPVTRWGFPTQNSVIAVARYGGQTIGSIMLVSNGGSVVGEFKHTIIANNSATSQRHIIEATGMMWNAGQGDLNQQLLLGLGANTPSSIVSFNNKTTATSSINSSANQTLGMEVRLVGSNGVFETAGHIVERIV